MSEEKPSPTNSISGNKEYVPSEFFNVRRWYFVYLVLFALGVLTLWYIHLRLLFAPGRELPQACGPVVVSALFALLAIALLLWTRASIIGYWMLVILVHILLFIHIGSIIIGIRLEDATMAVVNAVIILLILRIIYDVWSRKLLGFFKRVNGLCPVCKETRIREPKDNRVWICPKCGAIVRWVVYKKLKLKCSECGTRLKGATSDMIGDTAVCTKCKAEFEIRNDQTREE